MLEIFSPYLPFIAFFIAIIINVLLIFLKPQWYVYIIANGLMAIVLLAVGIEPYDFITTILQSIIAIIVNTIVSIFGGIFQIIAGIFSGLINAIISFFGGTPETPPFWEPTQENWWDFSWIIDLWKSGPFAVKIIF